MTDHAEDATQDIQTRHDEFHKACKTILPKVDHKLIEDLFRQQEDSEEGTLPMFSIEVITKKGLDTQEMKEHVWGKFGAMSAIFYVLRTGCQWNTLPRSLGASSTVRDILFKLVE